MYICRDRSSPLNSPGVTYIYVICKQELHPFRLCICYACNGYIFLLYAPLKYIRRVTLGHDTQLDMKKHFTVHRNLSPVSKVTEALVTSLYRGKADAIRHVTVYWEWHQLVSVVTRATEAFHCIHANLVTTAIVLEALVESDIDHNN